MVPSRQAPGNEAARKLAIWLSRYCLDPEATLAVAARVLDPSLPNASLPDPSLPDPGQAQAGAAVDGPGPTGTAGAHPISPTAAQTLAEPKLDSSKRSANRSRSKPNRPASQPGPVADGRRPSRRAAAAVPEQRVSVRPGSGSDRPFGYFPAWWFWDRFQ
ncbi:MAG: hypothetical protein HC824_00555 [Synechococcales cyanobacterium RM1_1_8]|nr:hypothetical protein [Synechococcales cyanobacterium RM1_1_8]